MRCEVLGGERARESSRWYIRSRSLEMETKREGRGELPLSDAYRTTTSLRVVESALMEISTLTKPYGPLERSTYGSLGNEI